MKTIEIRIKNYRSNIEVFDNDTGEDGIGRIYTATTDSHNYPDVYNLPKTREILNEINESLESLSIRISQRSAKEIVDTITANCHWL